MNNNKMSDNFFDNLDNMGSMLSDEQKQDMKAMGEKFYGSIDVDHYKPIPADDPRRDELFPEDALERMQFIQLRKAIDSGLLLEDFTKDEMQIFKKYHNKE